MERSCVLSRAFSRASFVIYLLIVDASKLQPFPVSCMILMNDRRHNILIDVLLVEERHSSY